MGNVKWTEIRAECLNKPKYDFKDRLGKWIDAQTFEAFKIDHTPAIDDVKKFIESQVTLFRLNNGIRPSDFDVKCYILNNNIQRCHTTFRFEIRDKSELFHCREITVDTLEVFKLGESTVFVTNILTALGCLYEECSDYGKFNLSKGCCYDPAHDDALDAATYAAYVFKNNNYFRKDTKTMTNTSYISNAEAAYNETRSIIEREGLEKKAAIDAETEKKVAEANEELEKTKIRDREAKRAFERRAYYDGLIAAGFTKSEAMIILLKEIG